MMKNRGCRSPKWKGRRRLCMLVLGKGTLAEGGELGFVQLRKGDRV